MGRSKSSAERVNILKKVRSGRGWKLVPKVERKGKLVRNHVWVAGARSTEGRGSSDGATLVVSGPLAEGFW